VNLAQVASLGLIDLYQRKISPRKGFVCAHNALFRAGGCSGYAKEEIAKKGVMRGLQSLAQRFRECAVAAKVVRTLRGARGRKKVAPRGFIAAAALSFMAMSTANANSQTTQTATSTPEYSDCGTAQNCIDGCFYPMGTPQPDEHLKDDRLAKNCAIEGAGNAACCMASTLFC
jgi:putative component of membrane protein insertase Oxa1/YidC/SpoIIIJ protein YidD